MNLTEAWLTSTPRTEEGRGKKSYFMDQPAGEATEGCRCTHQLWRIQGCTTMADAGMGFIRATAAADGIRRMRAENEMQYRFNKTSERMKFEEVVKCICWKVQKWNKMRFWWSRIYAFNWKGIEVARGVAKKRLILDKQKNVFQMVIYKPSAKTVFFKSLISIGDRDSPKRSKKKIFDGGCVSIVLNYLIYRRRLTGRNIPLESSHCKLPVDNSFRTRFTFRFSQFTFWFWMNEKTRIQRNL